MLGSHLPSRVAPGEHSVEIEWEINQMTYRANGTADTLKRLVGGTEKLVVEAIAGRVYTVLVRQGDPSRRYSLDFYLIEK